MYKNFKIKEYLKQIFIFLPIFLLLYNDGSNIYGNSETLYEDPFSDISSEEWIKESPLQYFLGFFIRLAFNSSSNIHLIIVVFGFIYLFISMYLFDIRYFNEKQISKILYFTPFFLILFSWMGKPDTFTVGSLLYLIVFNNNILLSSIFSIILVFSHPQIAFVYFLLIKYLKIYKFKLLNYLTTILSYLVYFAYYSQLNEFQGRFNFITNGFDRIFKTIFTNTLGGFVSLFMWLWIIIFLSGMIKDKKFINSFMLIFIVSFHTLDHTRIFTVLSIPLVIYLVNNKEFLENFENLFDNKIMYFLGIFQIQKRGDGKIVDGLNYYENEIFSNLINIYINTVENFLSKF